MCLIAVDYNNTSVLVISTSNTRLAMTRSKMQRGTRRSRNTRQIMTVAQDGDVQGARFDQMVSNARYNESAVPVLVKAVFGISSVTTGTSGAYGYTQLAAEDDFVSMAQQWNLFRVKAMRFEVFHVNPGTIAPVVLSTFHADGGTFTPYLTQGSVVDGPDSKYMDAGAGKQVFYWTGNNSTERLFQSPESFVDFGGLRFFNEGTTGSFPIARVIVTAQVVFKGRR